VIPTGTQAHWVGTDPSNQYLFVPNKGSDEVSQFSFDATTGQVTPNNPAQVATSNGAGPRHLAFHPSAPFAYLINELDDTMTMLAFDDGPGTLTTMQTLSTLPAGVSGAGNSCAELAVSPDGQFLYGSNRGHDSIVVYALDVQSGMMTLLDHTTTDIDTPRSFAIDPGGNVLLVANQGSNTVASFAIGATGLLTHLVTTPMPASPPFVGIFDLPAP
jgi:6-phosphogluconolactonase